MPFGGTLARACRVIVGVVVPVVNMFGVPLTKYELLLVRLQIYDNWSPVAVTAKVTTEFIVGVADGGVSLVITTGSNTVMVKLADVEVPKLLVTLHV
jgi:hypothetical protein